MKGQLVGLPITLSLPISLIIFTLKGSLDKVRSINIIVTKYS
jgi:hypothetical protein